MMEASEAVRAVQQIYNGSGWASVFARLKFSAAPFIRLIPLIPEEGFIIDLGCGYGIFANMLGMMSPRRTVLGLDMDEYKMKFAPRGIPNVRFQVADITTTDLPPADCIVLIHVLHHLPTYGAQEKLLRACVQKLKPGGQLVITDVDGKPRWKYILSFIADHILYPRDTITFRFQDNMTAMLKNLSLSVQLHPMHGGALFPHITYICKK